LQFYLSKVIALGISILYIVYPVIIKTS
jgi:hypothetical protein